MLMLHWFHAVHELKKRMDYSALNAHPAHHDVVEEVIDKARNAAASIYYSLPGQYTDGYPETIELVEEEIDNTPDGRAWFMRPSPEHEDIVAHFKTLQACLVELSKLQNFTPTHY